MLRTVAAFAVLGLVAATPRSASADSALPRADLHVQDLVATGEAVAGGELRLRARISSTGNQVMSFHSTAYLTVGGVLAGARALATFGPSTIGAEDTLLVDETVTLPTDVSGRFRVMMVVDSLNAVAEDNEFDNVAEAAGFTRVRLPAPDVMITRVRPIRAEAQPAGSVEVQIDLLNIGEIAASTDVAIYLSRNDAVSTDDPELGRSRVTLQPGRIESIIVQGTVPADALSGDYVVGALVDPDLTLDEVDELNNLGAAPTTINIISSELTLTTTSLPGGTVFIDYYARLAADGGDGHYRYEIERGRLPRGLRLDPRTGEIFGTTEESGTHAIEFGVSSAGLSDTAALAIEVATSGIDLTITTPQIGQGTVGLPFSAGLAVAGGEPPYEWALDDGALPPGIDLSVVGWLSGIPSVEGHFTFSIEVTDNLGAHDTIELEVVVESANVVILSGRMPAVPAGEPVDFALQASGGLPPHSWAALSTPPPGMSITEDGHLVGTPTRVGDFPVRVGVSDASGAGAGDTALLHLRVEEAGVFRIASTEIPATVIRSPVVFVLEAEGGTPPLQWTLIRGDSLPANFTLEADPDAPDRRAIIRGLSIRPMTHAFAVRVTDATTRYREATLAIEVTRPDARAVSGCTHVAVDPSRPESFGLLLVLGLLGLVRRRR